MQSALTLLRNINEKIAILAGLVLLASVVATVFDILARQLGHSLGGTDEISGYAMAIATSWGMAYTLTSLSHVRIDVLRTRLGFPLRALFDFIALACLAATACVVAYRVWPVLEKSIKNNSTANTTLETPLWIPQSLWMAGWAWFALSSIVLLLIVTAMLVQRQFKLINQHAGISAEE